MKECERCKETDLHIQDILLIGHQVQKSGLTIIEIDNPRHFVRGEAVAMSSKTPEEVVAALRGENDEKAIKEFLATLRGRHPRLIDELDPEVDKLIEAARVRASLS